MRALAGVEARSALLASLDQPKAASAACAVVQVRGSTWRWLFSAAAEVAFPSFASPCSPPVPDLSWPLLGPSLLGGVENGLEMRERLDPSGEGEMIGRQSGAIVIVDSQTMERFQRKKKKVSPLHLF